jgi:hypothetical protein
MLPSVFSGPIAAAYEKPADKPKIGQLLATYRDWGLPIPPPDAKLVLFELDSGVTRVNGREMAHRHALAFLLKPAPAKGRPLLLLGTQTFMPYFADQQVKPVEPDPKLVQRATLSYWYQPFEINAGLATALQCKARGWDALAAALLEKSLRESVGHPYGAFYQPEDLPPQTALAFLAWTHWGNELAKPDTNRAEIAGRMERLLVAEPLLKTEGNQVLLRRLRDSLKPSTAKPGSPEALVDALVNVADPPGSWYVWAPQYRRLVRQGFDAIPALIEHLDDKRLTRVVFGGMNNFPPRFYLVCDFTAEIVRGFADEDLLADRERGPLDVGLSKQTAARWWERARKEGERAYLLRALFPKESHGKYPRYNPAVALAAKYPQDLVRVYEMILKDRPDTVAISVVDALVESSLPREKKLELLRRGASHRGKGIRERCELYLANPQWISP